MATAHAKSERVGVERQPVAEIANPSRSQESKDSEDFSHHRRDAFFIYARGSSDSSASCAQPRTIGGPYGISCLDLVTVARAGRMVPKNPKIRARK